MTAIPGTTGWTRRFRPAGRRTNLALLCSLTGAFFSGWWAFAAGTPAPARVATVAHGVLALGLIILVPWKSVVVRRARAVFWASWGLLGLIVVCLVAGFIEVFAGYGLVGAVSPIQVHVGAALVAAPLFALHLMRHRRQGPRRADLSRRQLLRTGLFMTGSAALYGLVEGGGQLVSGPAAARSFTGSHQLAASAIPSTNWLFDPVPRVDPTRHQVLVAGRAFTVPDLRGRSQPVVARLDCTSGWYADATWSGVTVAALLEGTDLGSGVSLEVISVTGYRRLFPLAEASSLWLATELEGRPLRAGSGAPVRLVAPHRRGFWWVKWVAEVRLSERPAYAQSPFPLQ